MGKWAMYKRRGSTPPGEPTAPALPSVPLTVDGDDFLNWSGYAGPTPFRWFIYQGGVFFTFVAGASTDFDDTAEPTSAWTIQGVDASSAPVTQLSNEVQAP